MTLLHLPYTAWHLSYVVVGGCLAAQVSWSRLGLTVLAFFLAMGIGAHALDELAGRPLGTAIPSRVLVILAVVSITAACAIGIAVALDFSALDPAADRGRGVSRPGLQPRALRRPLPLGPLVRPRLGSVPRAHRLRRVHGDGPGDHRRRRRRGRRSSPSPNAGSRLRSGARAGRSPSVSGELELVSRRSRGRHPRAARRRARGRAPAARGRRPSSSQLRSSPCTYSVPA